MKIALILSTLILGALSLRADSVVILNDNGTVTRDGVSLNNASDALKNNALTSVEFMAALNAKLAAANAATAKAQSDLATQKAQMKQQFNADLTALKSGAKAAKTDTEKAVVAARIAAVQGYIDATDKSPDQLRVESLTAEIAAKQAELAKLQGAQK